MKGGVTAVAGAAVVIGLLLGSAAGGFLVLGYGAAAVIWWRQRQTRQQRLLRRAESLETLAGIAADLRAGAVPSPVRLSDPELQQRAGAAQAVSERTGAGLAVLFERMEAQQRDLSRMDSSFHAQVAGIRLTVLLLLLLPAGALLTGRAIGADPGRVLLHTEVGTYCTATALALQLTGIAWSNRLVQPHSRQQHTELAFAVDLIAAGLRAGVPVDQAILAAGEVLAGPLARHLGQVGYALRWGIARDAAWDQLLPAGPRQQRWWRAAAVAPERRVVLAAKRSGDSGAALAGALTRCADELRADALHGRQAAVHRAGVLLVLPLGLCFLPAFLLAGLVPVVIAVLGQVI